MANQNALPAAFSNPPVAKLCKYSFARANVRFRRTLAIANAIHQFNLAKCIVANWPAIKTLLASSPLSYSTPTRIPQNARAVSPKRARKDLPPVQAAARAGCRSIALADVAEFYPSLYTHSIPWACHTKPVAKINKSSALFGNQLDMLIRNAQDRQTIGIPIGPDTSFVIAELVMALVDADLQNKFASLNGLRWIDEYEMPFAERSQAEDAFAALQQALIEFELRLNPRKSRVADLPVEFEPEWIQELRAFRIRPSVIGQANDLIRYFDHISTFLQKNPNEHVIKYGIARLRTLPVLGANFGLFQSLLLQAATFEPGALREGIQALSYAETHHGLVVHLPELEMTLNTILEQNAGLGRDYEVSWCLWAAINWNIPISSGAASAVSTMSNSVVAILALDANQKGLINAGALNISKWQARMTVEDLYEEEWLLAYEANVQGWLPTVGGGDHVSAEAAFSALKQWGVHFYEQAQNPIMPGSLAYP